MKILCGILCGLYLIPATVAEINQENIVAFEDCNGNIWESSGVEDLNLKDSVELLMFDNFSAEIYDDIIIRIDRR